MKYTPIPPKCPKCGAQMTYGASHVGAGLQAECWSCGYVEQAHGGTP
jgi:ribosomal protein S27AE